MTEVEKQEFKEFLNSFTKKEIINAVADYHARLEFSGLKNFLNSQKQADIYDKMQQTSKEDDKARNEFFAYEIELAQKYGDGKSFNLFACTLEEKNKYALLYGNWKDKERQWIKANKEYDKVLGYEIFVENKESEL